jgi:DNA-binding MarR family transcriptional regulator
VSKVVNSVEKLGFVERKLSDADKRLMLFALTTSGLRKITTMKQSIICFISLMMTGI